MGRVLSCCATEAPKAPEPLAGSAPKPRRASVSKDASRSAGDKREDTKEKDKGAATSRSNASSTKGRSGRSSISQKQASLSAATTTSRSTKQEPKPGEAKVETQGSKSNAGGKEGKGRRSSTRTEDNEVADSKDPAVSPAAPTPPSAPSASPSAPSASPAESPGSPHALETEATKATQEAPKSKRASASPQATNPVVASGLPEVLAPVALDDATPSTTDFVLLRPLPYEPIPPDAGDSNKQRTFVFKGNLVVVPMLPLLSPREGSPKSAKQPPKNEDVRQNKGWKMVKSKVVGGAMKAE